MQWLVLLAPIVLELMKILFSKSDSEVKEKAAKDILNTIKEIGAALNKAEETGGDTSDIEDIINKR